MLINYFNYTMTSCNISNMENINTIQNKNRIYSYSIRDYTLMLLFLFTSNSIIYFQYLSPAVTYIIFFIVCIFNVIAYKQKIKHFKSFPILFAILIFINITIINPDTINRNGIGTLIMALASFFFFQLFDYYRFRFLYLKVVAMITLFSIPVYILYEMGILPTMTLTDTLGNLHTMFFIYHLGAPYSLGRMAGIWHEPGACMIFLNIALLLYIPELVQRRLKSQEIRYLIIIVVGILFTQSTTAYLCLILILVFCAWNNKRASFGKKIIMLFFCCIVISLLYKSDIIQEKFNQDVEENTSKGIRMRDNLSCFIMAYEHPFTGVGFGTKKFEKLSIQLDNKTSSNGILYIAACLGLYFIILYPYCAYREIRHRKIPTITALFIVLIFLILESNEAYVEFPVSYIFLAKFKSYNYIN